MNALLNSATSQQIAEFFDRATKEKKAVLVRGYVSSDGSVKDKLVMPLPKDGYPMMVRFSHALLMDEQIEPGDFPTEVWNKAKSDRLQAWEKYINPATAEAAPLRSKYQLRQMTSNVHEATDTPGVTIVAQLGDVSGVSGERKPSKDPVVNAKAWLEKQTPIDEYSGQLILSKDKFAGAELVDAPKESWTYKLFFCEEV